MLEKLALVAFITFCCTIVYFNESSVVEVYECAPKTKKSEPYFLGVKRDFEVLRDRVLYISEGDCLVQKMTRGEWYQMKNALRNTKGL